MNEQTKNKVVCHGLRELPPPPSDCELLEGRGAYHVSVIPWGSQDIKPEFPE